MTVELQGGEVRPLFGSSRGCVRVEHVHARRDVQRLGFVLLLGLMGLLTAGVGSASAVNTPACDGGGTFTINDANVITRSDACVGSVTIPDTVTGIADDAFRRASRVTDIEIPSSVTTIGDSAFSGTTVLRAVTFASPSNLTSIGEYAFYNSGLVSISIPGSVTSMGGDTFDSARSLASVTFGPGSAITTIPGWMFSGATSLTTITLPSTVVTIERNAFDGASSLSAVYFTGAAAPTVGVYAFDGVATAPDAVAYHLPGAEGFYPVGQPRFYGLIAMPYLPAPQAPVAVAGTESATVTLVPALVGPAPSSYVVTASPGGATCTVGGPSEACSFKGLTVGTEYTFTAVASMASPELTSFASEASVSVVPTAPVVPLPAVAAVVPETAAVTSMVPFSRVGSPRQTATGLVVSILANEPGVVGVRVTAVGGRALRAAPVVLCSMRQRVQQAGRVTLVCSYTKAARQLLARGAVRATQSTTFKPVGGVVATSTTTLALKRLSIATPSRVTG